MSTTHKTSPKTYTRKDFNFSEWGAFFAFSDKQFDEAKQEGVQYVSLFAGLIAPKDKAKEMLQALKDFQQKEFQRRIDIVGKRGIIAYELNNYEAYDTMDISDTLDALKGYNITEEEVRKVYNEERNKQNSSKL